MSEHDKFCAIWTSSEICICPYLKDARDDQDTISRADEREQVLAAMHKRIVREEPQPRHGGDPESWSKGYQFGVREMLDAAAARGEDKE